MSTLRPSSTSTTSTWIRRMPLWHGLFYMSLVLATGIALVEGLHTWQRTGVLLGLSLVFGLWYTISVVISPLSWQARPLLTMAYLAGGWSLWFGLTVLDPSYLFVLFGLYPQVFVLAPLPGKILGALLLTALCAWQQVTLAGGIGGNLFLTLAAGVSGILMALFIYTIVEQSQQQQRLIGELETTHQALATAERQAGILEERQRLAREIHDTLAQGFTSIVMHLEAAEAALPAELTTPQRHLDQARRTARENLVEARRLLWALQPAALERATLGDVLTHLAARWEEESGVQTVATTTGTVHALRPEIEVTLLRAAQEALANTHKHASASQVVLTLSYMEGLVVLDVQDNGVGFDTTRLSISLVEQPAGGFGLKALRERVEQLGGMLSIESSGSEGTTIAVALPAAGNEPPSPQEAAATAHIRAQHPKMAVLVLTTYESNADILRAIEAAATGYLLKDTPRDELFAAIRTVAQGNAVLAPVVAMRLLRQRQMPAAEALSVRELEVLTQVARGASNKEIARILHLSEATVKTHLIHLFGKLRVADRTAAVTIALERGLLRLEP